MASFTGLAGRCLVALLPLLLLQAKAQPTPLPGLSALAVVAADTTRTGHRWLLDVGALDDGGYAAAWLGREASRQADPWTLWVQRFDRLGRKWGQARQLVYADEVRDLRQVSALVRRDATVAVAWATWRPYQEGVAGLMVAAVRTRHFGLDGRPRGAERTLGETLMQPGVPGAQGFEDVVMAQWRDGRYLVGWTVVGGSSRLEFCVQRVAADGRPAAPLDRLGPMAGRATRLSTLDAGGWLASTIGRADDGHLYANITQVDVKPAMGLPLLQGLPARAFVVDLRERGRLLVFGGHAADAREVDSPRTLWFNTAGREAMRTEALPAMPTDGLALADGNWIGFWPEPDGSRMRAQRFDARGLAVGTSQRLEAGRALQAALLADGSLVLAWVGQGPDSSAGLNVFTQRFIPAP